MIVTAFSSWSCLGAEAGFAIAIASAEKRRAPDLATVSVADLYDASTGGANGGIGRVVRCRRAQAQTHPRAGLEVPSLAPS